MKRTAPFHKLRIFEGWAFLCCCLGANGQEPNSISSFRLFLQNPPAIEEIVFSLKGEGRGGPTSYQKDASLFRGRRQSNDFVLMEIKSFDSPERSSPTNRLLLAGRGGEIEWSIAGSGVSVTATNEVSAPGVVNGPRVMSTAAGRILSEALACGIIQLSPNTLMFDSESHFSAQAFNGEQIDGNISKLEKGRVAELTYHLSGHPERIFQIGYEYSNKSSDTTIPDKIVCSFLWNDAYKKIEEVTIFGLRRAIKVLPPELFKPDRFLPNATNDLSQKYTVFYTNSSVFWNQNGGMTPINQYSSTGEWWTRRWIWALLLFSALNIFIFLWLKRGPAKDPHSSKTV